MTEEAAAGGHPFGQRVRELRQARKRNNPVFSLRQFALRAGISPTFLSKIETGDLPPPNPATIVRIAELLEVNADELLALAKKVSPEVTEIICERPRIHADFLRSVRKLSNAQMEAVQQMVRVMGKQGGEGDGRG